MTQPLPQTRPAAPSESRDSAVLVDVLVLSTDLLLFDAIRAAIGERNPVWRARSAEESVDLLLTGRCGVLLVDMAAVSGTPATLITQIAEQFPDLVIVVAGRREDEALLAQLISSGCVYRFMHKPITAKRAGMFLQAAVRRHAELRDSGGKAPLLQLSAVLPNRFDPRKWLFVGAGVLIFVAILWLASGSARPPATLPTEEAPDPSPAAATAPTTPLADPVLSRARAAYAAGRYEAPAGRNALDLYAAVLLSKPGQPEASAGLESTVAHVVAAARAATARGDAQEAERLRVRLRDVAPELPAVAALENELAPPPPVVAPTAATPASVATASRAPTVTPRPSDLRPLRPGTSLQGPVTSIPRDTAVAAASAPAPRVVQRDPLAPRIANADELRLRELAIREATANLRNGRSTPSPAGAPAALPIAGSAARPATVASTHRTLASDPAVTAALAAPADDLGRIRVVDPVYPAGAMRDNVEGWVELEFTITETGSVRDIVVVDAEPRGVFDDAAIDALSAWKYRPRLANGQPVQRRSNVTLRFDVER